MALTPQARETFTRLFGAEPQPHPTDPELFDILQNEIFDEAFSTGVLTDVERELLTVTALTAMQTLPQLQAHVGAALNIGASPLQLRETIYQCAPYIGFPKTLNAIDIANGVFEAHGISLPLENAGTVDATDPNAREQAGAAIQTPLYGNEVKEVFSALPEPFDEFVPHLLTSSAFGDFATRGGLDVAQRPARAHQPRGHRRHRRLHPAAPACGRGDPGRLLPPEGGRRPGSGHALYRWPLRAVRPGACGPLRRERLRRGLPLRLRVLTGPAARLRWRPGRFSLPAPHSKENT